MTPIKGGSGIGEEILLRKIGGFIAAIVISFAGLTAITTPASASSSGSTTLCVGFKGCAKKLVSTHGYYKVYKQSFWSMAPGHNCTNYVAYRLTHNGRMTTKKSGFGSARDWYTAAQKHRVPTTTKPKVGDVAWWKKGAPGTSTGHVAYVDRVFPSGTIRISEDNYKGDFDVRYITKKSRYWPTRFIRFPKGNGDAWGEFASLTKTAKGISIGGYVSDGDKYHGARVQLSFNGPRNTPGTTQYTYKTMSGGYSGIWYSWGSSTVKPKTVYMYVLNAPGSKGKDKYIGARRTGW